MINWPNDLVMALARRRVVVFVGAGISRQSTNAQNKHPCTWREFLVQGAQTLSVGDMARKAIEGLIKESDYLTACELLKDTMGDQRFRGFITEKFVTPRFRYAPIHDSIISLGARLMATPNFDKIFETRINAKQDNSVMAKNYYDEELAEILLSQNPFVLKVHGSVDKTTKMIFTRSEYAKARAEFRPFYAILEALALTHTFLFLGCGLKDPDIQMLLEDYCTRHRYAAPHYFVLPEGALFAGLRSIYEKTLNIKILEYDPARDHRNLRSEIDALAKLASRKRNELAADRSW